ncbi:MAG: sulfur carrier protein ThiS [Deltaproteobacteria bacterium]|nr:sulfur carrier protein ThiS [Deltaproteobacteria bacterium]
MVTLKVNGTDKEFDDNLNISSLLEGLHIKNPMIIVELNKDVISKDLYNSTLLKNGDNIEIITIMGGG